MDRRDVMAMSGSASLYMQTGMAGPGSAAQPGLNVSSGVNALPSTTMPFQSNIGASTLGSTLPMEPSTGMSPHGVNVATASAVPAATEPAKRRRGRPRKYGPDGSVSLALSSPSLSAHPGTITATQKRGRGRPPGTGRKQLSASLGGGLSGSAGIGFIPHIITVAVGEGPRAICILSANGAVSTVTLRQPLTSGGTVTYEGRFEILCLAGSYLLTSSGGSRNRSGGLSVSLASPDGRVIGGGVGGVLIAASPVQIIVGSFLWGGSKTKKKRGEAPEGAVDADHQTMENPVTPTSVPPSQSLTPASSAGLWSGSQTVDIHNTHVVIDLMHG
uniref:AT-hook motif nuclear-localized protein n=1 Tax=Rhizophora mucronata TaxID=61149 RepID=A0A2P2LZQ0_RHIMU